MSRNYESYRREVENALSQAENRALEAIGQFGESNAKLLCPVGEYPSGSGRVGGNLRSSISHKVDEAQKGVHIGTNVDYGIYPEKGTRKMAAQPYLTPAIENNLQDIKEIIENNLRSLDGE